ncbi:MAG: hypothetical protein ABSB71_07250 [Candidatus Bathyarchaeia archaeon]
MTVYQTKPPEYEAMTKRAGELGLKLEFGGGRKTKGGESPNAQMIFNLKKFNSKISVSRTGRVIIYYPSKLCLERCVEILISAYIPTIDKSELQCQGPKDPLSMAFELRTTENWKGSGLTLAEAAVRVHQWFDPKTKEYLFVMPDDDGRVVPPSDLNLIYAGSSVVTIKTIDKEDINGKRIVTAEKLRWQAMKELKRVYKEHRLKPEDLERARQKKDVEKAKTDIDLVFEC